MRPCRKVQKLGKTETGVTGSRRLRPLGAGEGERLDEDKLLEGVAYYFTDGFPIKRCLHENRDKCVTGSERGFGYRPVPILGCTCIGRVGSSLLNSLYQFPNQSFDYVVLSQTLQAFYNPEKVLRELLRIGKSVIISIPNFGYWKVRMKLLFFGEMPVTKTLPNTWYNTPNLHMCTIKDLFNFCDEKNINIKRVIGVNENQTSSIKRNNLEIKNLFSKLGIFLIG